MGMFKDLMNKIFRQGANAERPYDAAPSSPGGGGAGMGTPGQPGTFGSSPGAVSQVDVGAILDKMASENKEKLDWKHSIVDLLKLVGMESSMDARKDLASDLHYTGDTSDSATMNTWLHKEVMRKLAENGGKVSDELLSY